MDSKQITLRSQTKKCPHCGEYYSVTYKFCPFCDAAREEAEREEAAKKEEKKTKKQAFLGSLFSGASEPAKKKKSPPAGSRPASRGVAFDQDAPETARRAGPRKKMSQMTEEERAAYIAEREARAAQRKRDRERAARMAEANGVEGTTLFDQDAPERPVRPAAPQPEAQPAGEVEVTGARIQAESNSDGMESRIINLSLHRPEVQAVTQGEPTRVYEDPATGNPTKVYEDPEAGIYVHEQVKIFQPDESSVPMAEPVVQPTAPAAPEKTVASEDDLDAILGELRSILEDSPVPTLTPEEIKRSGKPAPEAAPAEPAPAPAAEPEVPPMAAPVVQTEEDRLAEEGPELLVPETKLRPAPTPTQRPSGSWIETAKPEAAPEAEAVPEPAPEPVPASPEDAQPVTGGEWLEPGQTPVETPEVPSEEPQAAPAAAEELEPDLLPVAHRPNPQGKTAKTAKKTGGPNGKRLALLILSVVIIIAAIFIVARTVVPAFQEGIFSSQKGNDDQDAEGGDTPVGGAEAITLNKDDASYSEMGATFLLEPTFAPEGTSSAVIWTSSDPNVATVDETGLVTTVGPGTATITATIESGASAQCTVRCNWTDNTPQPAAGPALSTTDLTLDSQGATRELQVIGVNSTVTWTSGNTDIATVASDGTVTAVGKGRTTVTAKFGQETLVCEVRCIW